MDPTLKNRTLTSLKEKMPMLSPRLRIVAKYIVDHPSDFGLDSIRETARKSGVSTYSLVRAANSLGFESYDQLREPFRHALVTEFSLAPLVEAVGERPCPVSRAGIQGQMIAFWGRKNIHFGKRVERVSQTEDSVTAYFTDGTSATGDFMIAADGGRSIIRNHVLGYQVERRYAGYVNWYGLVDIDTNIAPAEQWTTYVAEGKRVSIMPIAGGQFYFFFDVPLPLGLEENRDTLVEDLKGYFKGWSDQVQLLIDSINPQTTNRVEIHDIEPFPTLVKGNIALLGDSAHSTTPDIGQGGCSAMEDSVVLGQCFAKLSSLTHESVVTALKDYEGLRRDRVKDLVLKARKRSQVTHGENMQETQAWYDELKLETGENIIAGLKATILGGPLG